MTTGDKKGWRFPPSFNGTSKQVEMVESVEAINQAIYLVIYTNLGERAMLPDFGSRLQSFMFQKLDSNNAGMLKSQLKSALRQNEPRIKVTHIALDEVQGGEPGFRLSIEYLRYATGTTHRFTYPYDAQSHLLNSPRGQAV